MSSVTEGDRRWLSVAATGVLGVLVLAVGAGAATLQPPPVDQAARAPVAEADRDRADASEDPKETTATCVNEDDGVEVAYPADWHHTGESSDAPCRAFAPHPVEPEPLDAAPGGAAIFIDVLAVEFSTHVAETVDAHEHTDEEIVDHAEVRTSRGHDAVRYETVATGDGFYAAGTRVTHWVVDLGDRTARLHTDDELAPGEYDHNVAVLDAMAASLKAR